jgi:glycosyltransferase involved in cell wall biosynthesis
MPLFSVIIPVYNSEKYLNKCIKSVLNQKNNKTEIILIEDCSTDSSLKVCNSFQHNPSVNIIRHKKNLGVSISRNDGILAAKGKYILFLDSDDWLYPGCLKNIEKLITINPKTEVIIGRYNSNGFPFNNKILFKKRNSNTFSAKKFFSYINQLNFRPMIIWHYIVKKSLINNKKLYFVDVKNGEDEEFGARLLCSMKLLYLYNKNYYWHKKRVQGSLRYSRSLKSTESYLKLLVEYYKFISKTTLSSDKQKFINECVRFAYGEFSARIILHSKTEIKKLSSNLRKYINNSKISLNKIKNKNIYLLLKNKNILQHKDLVAKNILNILKNIKFKFSKIYIYCAAIHGVATLNILQKNKFKVASLVDDNLDIEKQTFVNVNVITGKSFLKIEKRQRSKILILVCQQTIETFDNIARKMKLNGIKSNQIINVRY